MESLKSIKVEDLIKKEGQPILDIAASTWENDKYDAFKTCYRSMRKIDDLVDNRKSASSDFSFEEKDYYSKLIKNWINSLIDNNPNDSSQEKLLKIITEFKIPLKPWIEFSKSMIYDINNNGFKSFGGFIKYSEGAAISPGTIFMHLCGIRNLDGVISVPEFDAEKAARPLSIFSYLVHIVRDFQKDQNNNLNYIPDNLLIEYGLTHANLREIAAGGKIGSDFRKLMEKFYEIIKYYRNTSRYMLDSISNYLEPRYKLSLELVYSLYLQIFEKIDIQSGSFTSNELNPSLEEIRSRVAKNLSEYQYV